jgi:UDP-glucose 4-epimerase
MNQKMKKILISGGTGEIGSFLTEKLYDKYNVVLLGRKIKSDRINKLVQLGKIAFVEWDITKKHINKTEISDIDCLIHLASYVKESRDINDAKELIEANVFGTANILRSLPNLSSVVFASSCSVYGSEKDQFDENCLTKPNGYYAASKVAAEKMLGLHCEDNNIKLCILRISSVYSPLNYSFNTKRAIQIFAESIEKEQLITIFGNGTNKRDYIFLEDAVDGIIWGMNQQGIFNISTGEPVSLNKVIDILSKISGKEAQIKYIKNFKQLDYNYSSDKAFKLGFSAKIPIEVGLNRVHRSVK